MVAVVPKSELQQPPIDPSLLRGRLESSPIRHATAGREPRQMHPESGSGSVLMPDMEIGSSEAEDSHYAEEDVVHCGSNYGMDTAEEDEEAVLRPLTSKFPDLPLPDVEDLDVARFCEVKQDRPCHLWCCKDQPEADNHPVGEAVGPAGFYGGYKAADVGPFVEAVEEMKVDEDRGLWPKVIPAFSPPLTPIPLPVCPHVARHSPRFSWCKRTSTSCASC